MKKYILFSVLCVFVQFLIGQTNRQVLSQFQKETNAIISFNELSQTPEFIRFNKSQPLVIKGNDAKAKATQFLLEYSPVLGIASNQLKLSTVAIDNYGLKHVTYMQHINNIPVFDGQLKVHFDKNLNILSINGNILPISNIDITPLLTINTARNKAIEVVNNQQINYSGVPLFVVSSELMIFRKGLVNNTYEGDFLTYAIEVRNDTDVREYLYIDAKSGKLVEQFTGMAHTVNRIVYENNTDSGSEIWQEGDAIPGALDIWQQNEVVTSEHVYNFFKNTFNYSSYDDADAQMRTVNNANIGCPNANWNGVTANFCNGTASDDVIAHEWGHAYTEYTNGLIYYYQSGAINESYSDIWGETIDILNGYEDAGEDLSVRNDDLCETSLRWFIAEDATSIPEQSKRDMWNPTCKNSPGKVTDTDYWCSSGDFGGVHFNSGVPNHAFALLVDGGNYNGQNINGIGFVKAVHIFWRTQKEYLTATSDFNVLANALEASANDLLGINLEDLTLESITTGVPAGLSGQAITGSDINELNKVLLAVELNVYPSFCNFNILLDETTILCDNATNSPLFKEDWETDMTDWVATQLPENPSTWEARDWVLEPTLPKGRIGQGVFGIDPINGSCSNGNLQNGILRLESPMVTAPSDVVSDYRLAFNHSVSTESLYDGANIKYRINSSVWNIIPESSFVINGYNNTLKTIAEGNDNPLESEPAFTGRDEGELISNWATSVVDLASLGFNENESIQFRFEVGTDGCNGAVGWYIDEIYVYSCSTALSVDSFSFLDENLTVTPNPSNGLFTLNNSKNIELEAVKIYDINGRIIKTIILNSSVTQQNIKLTDVASGVYFVKVTSAFNSKTFKLIKN